MKTCSFFGHSNIFGDIEEKLIYHIEYGVNELGVRLFYVGNNGEFDKLVAKVMVNMRKKYPQIQLVLALAYLPTEKNSSAPSTFYDGTVYFAGTELSPKRFSISQRNRLMVKNSDCIICYINREYGGAYSAVKYAKNQGKLIFNCAK